MASKKYHSIVQRNRLPYQLIFSALLIAYILLALFPFEIDLNRISMNNGAKLSSNKLVFNSPGIVHYKLNSKLLEAIKKDRSFQLKLRVKSAESDQQGPARILTVSKNTSERNLSLAQRGTSLVIRLRTKSTTVNGVPELVFENLFHGLQWVDINLEVTPETIELSIENRIIYSNQNSMSPIDSWSDRYHIALGNELTANRPWRGEISTATIRTEKRDWNLLSVSETYIPLVVFRERSFRWYATKVNSKDLLLNFFCFIPMGFSLFLSLRNPNLFVTLIPCALLSVTIELAQIVFVWRNPSVFDLITNTSGGFAGGLLAISIYSNK